MKKAWKVLLTLLVVVTLFAGLTACGNQDETTEAGQSSTVDQTSTEEGDPDYNVEEDLVEGILTEDMLDEMVEEEATTDSALFDRTIVCMHARPLCEQFNNNVAKVFQHYVKNFPGLMFCVNGHDHQLRIEDLYKDGTIYYGLDSTEHKSYMLFTITKEGYEYEIVRF
jgi:hypothetical protein